MRDRKPTYIISDMPKSRAVDFNFDAYAKTIADLIANKNNRTPLVIGIYGPWGAGKTTLMQTVQDRLATKAYYQSSIFRSCKTVWFQAWKYTAEEQILAALIEEIFRAMRRDNFFVARKADLDTLVKRLNLSSILGKAVEKIIGFDPADYIGELAYKEKLGFYDTFQEFFDRLIWTYTRMRPKLNADEAPDDTKGALAIFIDDLDRCPRERIVRVLETIKIFMDKKGCVFILGADNEIIESALSVDYGPDGALRFMDKIVQVTFRLPQIQADDFTSFLHAIAPQNLESIKSHLPVILPALRYNPRQLKRFLNNINLLEALLRNSNVDVPFDHLLFWNVIELVYPRLARDLVENPATLDLLHEHGRALLKQHPSTEHWEPSQEMLKPVPKSLQNYLRDKRLVDLVAQFNITREQLTSLCTLSSVVMTEVEKGTKSIPGQAASSPDDMVLIPAGRFLYGMEKRPVDIESDFFIDRYPVTNSQFAKFIEAKGYETDNHWSAQGIEWRNREKISTPAVWSEEKWNSPEHPVVGVSWFEADAYARWAGKSLPTEIQWERVARGVEGNEFPWGDEFDKEKCNTSESGIGKTTHVTRYPNGISPEGCYDMAGNVWEWTSSKYDEERYVLKGGCWLIYRDDVRCINRDGNYPDGRGIIVGFRCVRTK